MKQFDISAITDFKFKCKWKPDASYHKDLSELIFDKYLSGGYWDVERAMDSHFKKMPLEQFMFMWNTKPNKTKLNMLNNFLNEGSSYRTPEEEREVRKNNRLFIANALLDQIPVDFDYENNKARAGMYVYSDQKADYLNEAVRARIAGEDKVYELWIRMGLSHSLDAEFFEYYWSTIKREKGSVDKKLSLLGSMFSNEVFSTKILQECAKRGTKRIKRSAVDSITDIILSKRRSADRHADESSLRQLYLRRMDEAEEILLLFADSSDYTVVRYMSESLSSKNLPWIMPSAAQWPHLMSDIQRRIDRDKLKE